MDADLEFENCTWVLDTLKILNVTKDIVQIFSNAADMDNDEKYYGNNTIKLFIL